MSKAPPIPPEQRAFAGEKPHIEGDDGGGRAARRGKNAADLDHQGRSGNIRQNTAPARHVQDR
jgi:hypothetical protein